MKNRLWFRNTKRTGSQGRAGGASAGQAARICLFFCRSVRFRSRSRGDDPRIVSALWSLEPRGSAFSRSSPVQSLLLGSRFPRCVSDRVLPGGTAYPNQLSAARSYITSPNARTLSAGDIRPARDTALIGSTQPPQSHCHCCLAVTITHARALVRGGSNGVARSLTANRTAAVAVSFARQLAPQRRVVCWPVRRRGAASLTGTHISR